MRWVDILHGDAESCIMNNGKSTGYFKIQRGTRQGDPLAPYIFLMIIEVISTIVNQNPEIKGIEVNGTTIKQCLFADDTTFFLQDIDSLQTLINTLNTFGKYSSLQVNYDKSEAAWIGSSREHTSKPVDCIWKNLTKDAIKKEEEQFSFFRTSNSVLVSFHVLT